MNVKGVPIRVPIGVGVFFLFFFFLGGGGGV